jgi:ubiquitin-activating enzyme E1
MMAIVGIDSDSQKNIIKKLSYTCAGKTSPMDSIIGSIVSQEVIKAISHRYTPIKQWMYIDYTSLISIDSQPDLAINNLRYGSQINIFGNELQNKINNSDIFIVGAGAIGCELLKNLAMVGVGNITVTDMDTIEKSNLNRQFLFRYQDIGKFKADCAKTAILRMNPNINVVSQKNKVSEETTNIYGKEFFSEVTCVMTALDNVQARSFVDQLCVENCKPLIDSGTLGTKGNVQTIIPHVTESYRSTQDPPEKSIPMCTLKNFPYLTDHTIQWARNLFEGIFVKAPQNFLRYKSNPNKIKQMNPSELSEVYDDIIFVHENSVSHPKECIQFAYKLWHENFRDQINHLITKYPLKSVTTEGAQFWSGTKKFPKVLKFTDQDSTNIDFLEATSNLWADVFSLEHVTKKQIAQFLKKAKAPQIKPQSGDIIIDEKQLQQKPEPCDDKTADTLPDVSDLQEGLTQIDSHLRTPDDCTWASASKSVAPRT